MNPPVSNLRALPGGADLDEAVGLLNDALSRGNAPPPGALDSVRKRLLGRVADSAARHQGLVTARGHHALPIDATEHAQVRWLYRANDTRERRPGEPQRLALVTLRPGGRVSGGLGLAVRHSEWLVVEGSVTIDGLALDRLDHHGRAASEGEPVLATAGGATVYLRDNGDQPSPAGTSRARHAQWENFAPGIRRRLLWQAGDVAAYVAHAHEGAAVPAHAHLIDEECLMIEGELFVGDVLLCRRDFQLAPAGLSHGIVQAARESVIYLRGDTEMRLLPSD
jgi:hypothetical protein